ncbi:MAG: hypothetical protein ACFFDT_23120 [Candidatus Hodarchaeota archaeon]
MFVAQPMLQFTLKDSLQNSLCHVLSLKGLTSEERTKLKGVIPFAFNATEDKVQITQGEQFYYVFVNQHGETIFFHYELGHTTMQKIAKKLNWELQDLQFINIS